MTFIKFVHVSLFLFLQILSTKYAQCDFLKNIFSKTNHFLAQWDNIIGTDSNSSMYLKQLENNRLFNEGTFRQNCFLQANEKSDVILIKLYKQDIPSKHISTYYGQISVGEQLENKFNVLFDTGSSEFWIPFEKCKGPNFNSTHNKYKRTNSFKYKYDSKGLPYLLEVDYLSGKISGFDGYDTVNLGMDIAIPDTNIGFATYIDIPVLENFKWDGIVGLGFENEDSKKRGIKPFLDHIKDNNILTNKNYKNMFGYYLTNDGGYITLGGIDNRLKRTPDDEIFWTPVSSEKGYWTIDILGVRKETKQNLNEEKNENEVIIKYEGFHDGGKNSIVDSGSFLIYAPKKTMDNYLSDLVINSCDDKHNLPHIIFQVRAKELSSIKGLAVIELVLSPDDYVIEYFNEVDNTKSCIIGIQSDEQATDDQINGWTLGQVFLKSYYTIFDRDNSLVGFVRSKRQISEQSTYLNKPYIGLRTKRNKRRS